MEPNLTGHFIVSLRSFDDGITGWSVKIASVQKVGHGVARIPELWFYYASFRSGIVGLRSFVNGDLQTRTT